MNQCSKCAGFIPEGRSGCPNCGTHLVPRWKKILGLPLAIAGAGATAVTLSACYGPACATTLPDGTQKFNGQCFDCTQPLADGGVKENDPNWRATCLEPDAGTDAGCDGGTDGGC
jgi:hypothetical protein